MGNILEKLNSDLAEKQADLKNPTISADEREFVEEEIEDLKQLIAETESAKSKKGVHEPKEGKKVKKVKEPKVKKGSEIIDDMDSVVINTVIVKIQSAGKPLTLKEIVKGTVAILKKRFKKDARFTNKNRFKKEIFTSLLKTDEFKKAIGKTDNGKYDLIKNIKEAKSEEKVAKAKKEESKPEPEIKHKLKKTDLKDTDKMKVGEIVTDKDGNILKRTATDTYILEYHKNKNDGITFHRKGDKWLVDCCKKKDITFNSDDIDKAVSDIIEGLDCHYTVQERKGKSKKQKEARKRYENLPEAEKIENALEKVADSIENKVEDLKEDGKGITEKQAKDFTKEIKDIVKTIKSGIKAKEERKAFIQQLIKYLQSLD